MESSNQVRATLKNRGFAFSAESGGAPLITKKIAKKEVDKKHIIEEED